MVNKQIPLELIDQIIKGDCVLFVGTQSIKSDFDNQLVEELSNYCDYKGVDQSITGIAQYYEIILGRQSLIERVSNWVEAIENYSPQIDQLLCQLPFSIVVTTRTDLFLEEGYRQVEKPLVKVVRDEEVAFGDNRKVFLIKIHGSIDQKDTLVISERDHLALFRKRPVLSEYLKVLYATKSILFIGYNLDDLHFKLLHREMIQEIGRFSRRAYAVWEGANTYAIQYWQNDNIKVINQDPLTFLKDLIQGLSTRKTETHNVQSDKPKVEHLSPYKFLDHFDTEDADLFFGRQYEISILTKRILTHRHLVIFGASGVGKTSIIKAGIFPELRDAKAFSIYSRCLDAPLVEIEKAITSATVAKTGWSIDASGSSNSKLLNLLLNCQQAVGQPIVLFIDQLEELFRLPYETQQEFIKQLSYCVNDYSRLDLRLVISLREDYFTDLDNLREFLPFIYRNVFRIQKLPDSGAIQAIVRPLEYFDAKFEDKLVELLIEELRSEGSIAPAQLQIVCSRLYEKFAHEKVITVEQYQGSGGARSILEAYLEEALARFKQPLRNVARRILQALVSSTKTKNLLSGSDIAKSLDIEWHKIENLVSELEDYRLLRKIETEEDYKYELVHEYIVQQVWEWFTENEARVKELQEIIDTEVRLWSKFKAPISSQKLDAIYQFWDQLSLSEAHLELLFRSSIAFKSFKPWNGVAGNLGNQLIPIYSRLLHDGNLEVVQYATIALIQMGAKEIIDKAIAKIDLNERKYIEKTLRQIEAGRPTLDFEEEIAKSVEWKEKSLWNLSSFIGIDFGTTSSAISIVRGDKPFIIPNKEGSKFTPSVVAFTEKGEIVVGTSALLQAPTNPDRTVFSIKRHLGTDWNITIDDQIYSSIDIAVFILESLKRDAESYLERKVLGAVVAIPAYFSFQQRRALNEAAQKAGFEVLRMVAEPTCAALAYGLEYSSNQIVAVYDLGGGTFDISILDSFESVFQPRAVNGDTSLGGDDFDTIIINYLIEEFKKQTSIDISGDKVALTRLKEAAERAKITLSGLEIVNIYIPYLYADKNGIKHLDVDLSRTKFDELTGSLVARTISSCRNALKDARLLAKEIDELVLVGLSTKIPNVRQSVAELFEREPKRGVDPDEAVALGAAIQAGVLGGKFKEFLLLDVIPFTLSIETLGGVATGVIERNTVIPTRIDQIYSTASDNQTQIEIHILEGERPMAAQNRSLGKFILDGIPPASRGTPQIEVRFEIDANSILKVTARDKATSRKEQKVFNVFSDLKYTLEPATDKRDEAPINKQAIERFIEEDRKKEIQQFLENHTQELDLPPD